VIRSWAPSFSCRVKRLPVLANRHNRGDSPYTSPKAQPIFYFSPHVI
jgi:hypothetical protein